MCNQSAFPLTFQWFIHSTSKPKVQSLTTWVILPPSKLFFRFWHSLPVRCRRKCMRLWLKLYLGVVALRWFYHECCSHAVFLMHEFLFWDNRRFSMYVQLYQWDVTGGTDTTIFSWQACHSGTVLGAHNSSNSYHISSTLSHRFALHRMLHSTLPETKHSFGTLSSILRMGVWKVNMSAIACGWRKLPRPMLYVLLTLSSDYIFLRKKK